MGLPENIDALLVKYDITQDALARIAKVTPGAVSGWRNGSTIRKSNLKNICDYFGLTEDDLLSSRTGLAAKEHGRYIPNNGVAISGSTATIPVVGHVHAGELQDIVESDYITQVPQCIVDNHPQAFGYINGIEDGDCMNEVFPDSCLLVVDPKKEPQDGSIGVFLIDGYQEIVRRVHRGASTLVLSPESTNPEHEDIVITKDGEHTAEPRGTVVFFQATKEFE